MKIKKILLIFSLLICVVPYNVFAFCSSNTLQTYRGYARDVKIKYTLVNNDVEGGNFRLTFNNMNYNIYAKDKSTGIIYKRYDEENLNELVTSNRLFQGGTKRTIEYHTSDPLCPNEIIYTINLNIPKYNIYYNTETCNNITNYEYCDEYVFTNLSNAEIKKKIDDYRISHGIDLETNNHFYLSLPIIIGGGIGIIILIILIVYIIIKHKKKKEEW